ncbi:acyl-CoA dehydrogenase family protein [Streptomyces sp. NPDC049915]|uniref:acyl-CoA dehydrogenase family protein n=1 Tax=Streptomyces sp. NPDC049915 TaxID=3155510 RepID=UPI00343BF76D
MTSTATRTAGGYHLNGQKAWISNAGEAERYVVFAKTDPAQRSRGVTAFLLRKGTDGMEFDEPMRKMGQRAIVCREIFLNDVSVPEEGRLGRRGVASLA